MQYISVEQAADKWNISPRCVQILCEQGRIEVVSKLRIAWPIPKNAEKPLDSRRNSK